MRNKIVTIVALFLFYLSFSAYSEELDTEARAFRGQILSMSHLGQHDEILSSVRELYKSDPSDDEIARAYLDALYATQNMNEALDVLDDIYNDKLNSREYYEFKIRIYEAQQNYVEAARIYQFMYENQIVTDENILWMIGERYSWSGDNLSAIKYFELYEAKNLLNKEQKLLFADVLYWSMKYDKAALKYQQVRDEVLKSEKKSLQFCKAYVYVDESLAVNICLEASKAWPDSLDIKAQYADVLFKSGDIESAEILFDELAQLNPTDLKLQENAIRVLASVRRYERAKNIARKILEIVPDHKPIRLWYARILSWNKEYSFSVDQYDILISQKDDEQIYYREKARVLSWMRKYRSSEDVYKMAIKKFDDKALAYEAKAHYDKNRSYYRWAKINLDNLRKLEPQNVNAKIESALLYSELGLWDNAQVFYQSIIKDAPLMNLPQQAYDKNLIYSKQIRFEKGYSFYEANSSSRISDVFYHDVYSSARAPINKSLYFYNKLSGRFYRFPSLISRLNRYRNDIGVQYYWRPNLWFDLSYGYADKTDKVETSHNGHMNMFVEYFEPVLINLKYQRDDVEDNATTLYRHLQKDDYMIRVRYDTQKRYYLGADYTYSNYTDGNEKSCYGADVTFNVTYEPKRLSLIYRFEEYGFRHARNWYFAPSSFKTHGPGLEWRHYLNKDELFWGSNDTYYTLRYGMNIDSGGENGHKLYMDLHRDWTDSLSTHIEYNHIIYEHQGAYEQRGLRFYIRWYW